MGPLLFTIFINDLPQRVKHLIKLYADDCKLIGVIKEPNDKINLQNDINLLQNWAKTWQMSFNYEKCKVMHFGKYNPETSYNMKLNDNGLFHHIEKSVLERDLGLLISNDLKWANQIDKVTKTANAIIAQIRQSFNYFDPELVKMLYVALVRPHLEFAVSVWNPYLRKDIYNIEKIQRKATRMIPNLKRKSYEHRLKVLKLTTLETRRKRGDLIQFYKILNNIDQIKWLNQPVLIEHGISFGPSGNLRGKGLCFHRENAKIITVREEFFLNRTIPLWNELPVEVKNSITLNSFKANLDKLDIFNT